VSVPESLSNSALTVCNTVTLVVTNCDSARIAVTNLYTVFLAALGAEHTRLGCMPLATYVNNTLVLALVHLCSQG
jgi:hypothetical protein